MHLHKSLLHSHPSCLVLSDEMPSAVIFDKLMSERYFSWQHCKGQHWWNIQKTVYHLLYEIFCHLVYALRRGVRSDPKNSPVFCPAVATARVIRERSSVEWRRGSELGSAEWGGEGCLKIDSERV